MSLRLVIPWRVALQQSSPPRHQPMAILNEEPEFEKFKILTASVPIENCLNRGVHPILLCFCASLWHHLSRAPVAQLDRASDFGSEGRRFEPCWVHHLPVQMPALRAAP